MQWLVMVRDGGLERVVGRGKGRQRGLTHRFGRHGLRVLHIARGGLLEVRRRRWGWRHCRGEDECGGSAMEGE